MDKMQHNHAKVFAEICDYLGGDLDSAPCREIRDHLESCPECAVYFDSIRKTVYLFRQHEKDLKTPPTCRDRILAGIHLAAVRKKR